MKLRPFLRRALSIFAPFLILAPGLVPVADAQSCPQCNWTTGFPWETFGYDCNPDFSCTCYYENTPYYYCYEYMYTRSVLVGYYCVG